MIISFISSVFYYGLATKVSKPNCAANLLKNSAEFVLFASNSKQNRAINVNKLVDSQIKNNKLNNKKK